MSEGVLGSGRIFPAGRLPETSDLDRGFLICRDSGPLNPTGGTWIPDDLIGSTALTMNARLVYCLFCMFDRSLVTLHCVKDVFGGEYAPPGDIREFAYAVGELQEARLIHIAGNSLIVSQPPPGGLQKPFWLDEE